MALARSSLTVRLGIVWGANLQTPTPREQGYVIANLRLCVSRAMPSARHMPGSAVPATPHIYAVAQRAYKNLLTHNHNQCCLISGESGAGKTETAKFFLAQLLCYESSTTTILQRRILESVPLLESFGNAKTKLNTNSSRFGKYIEVMYDSSRVCGAKVSTLPPLPNH